MQINFTAEFPVGVDWTSLMKMVNTLFLQKALVKVLCIQNKARLYLRNTCETTSLGKGKMNQ